MILHPSTKDRYHLSPSPTVHAIFVGEGLALLRRRGSQSLNSIKGRNADIHHIGDGERVKNRSRELTRDAKDQRLRSEGGIRRGKTRGLKSPPYTWRPLRTSELRALCALASPREPHLSVGMAHPTSNPCQSV